MAHLPVDDARELFDQTNPKTWEAFHRVLQEHWGKAQGIENNLVALMEPISRQLEQSGRPFPSTPQELQEIINHEFATTGHRGYP
jgi:hypothetical protein